MGEGNPSPGRVQGGHHTPRTEPPRHSVPCCARAAADVQTSGANHRRVILLSPSDMEDTGEWLLGCDSLEQAWCELGHLHYHSRNYPAAVALFRRAGERGHPLSQTRLAACYISGRGVEQDLEMAAEWTRLAADQGGGG